jgi:hypothetical protein
LFGIVNPKSNDQIRISNAISGFHWLSSCPPFQFFSIRLSNPQPFGISNKYSLDELKNRKIITYWCESFYLNLFLFLPIYFQ